MALVVYTGINNYPNISKSSVGNKVSNDDAPSSYVGLSNQGCHCPPMIILIVAYYDALLFTAHINLLYLTHTPYESILSPGATCYLNSVIQTMFMTPDFRRAVFKWKYDKMKDGEESLCIPLQLQRLFGYLQLSKSKAVDTVDLTRCVW